MAFPIPARWHLYIESSSCSGTNSSYRWRVKLQHYSDVIMSTMASQITSVSIICWTIYSVVEQRKHQSSVSLAFVREIHQWLVDSPHKGLATRKMFPFDGIVMIHNFVEFSKLWTGDDGCSLFTFMGCLHPTTITGTWWRYVREMLYALLALWVNNTELWCFFFDGCNKLVTNRRDADDLRCCDVHVMSL